MSKAAQSRSRKERENRFRRFRWALWFGIAVLDDDGEDVLDGSTIGADHGDGNVIGARVAGEDGQPDKLAALGVECEPGRQRGLARFGDL